MVSRNKDIINSELYFNDMYITEGVLISQKEVERSLLDRLLGGRDRCLPVASSASSLLKMILLFLLPFFKNRENMSNIRIESHLK